MKPLPRRHTNISVVRSKAGLSSLRDWVAWVALSLCRSNAAQRDRAGLPRSPTVARAHKAAHPFRRIAIGFLDIRQRGFIVPKQELPIQFRNQIAITYPRNE